MPRPGVTTSIRRDPPPESRPPDPEPPEPIPDPVADLIFIPSAPTSDDLITVVSASNVADEHVERYTWRRLAPDMTNSYDHPWTFGPMPPGPVVVSLAIRLHDGRESAARQRGVTVTEPSPRPRARPRVKVASGSGFAL